MKYSVYIPSQELEIDADSEDEALEKALEQCELEACVEEIMSKDMPDKDMSAEYYIDLAMSQCGPFPNQYMKFRQFHCCFTDGHRIYIVPRTYIASLIKDHKYIETKAFRQIKNKLSRIYLSDDVLAETNISVQIDVQALEEKLQESEYKDQEYYTIFDNGITKVVKAMYLLEAIYFTGSNICRINPEPNTMIHLGSIEDKFAGILPLTK